MTALLLAAALAVPSADKEEGFVRLFDGRTFDGWDGNLKAFRIEDGAIVGGTLKERVPRNEFLTHKREFADFELRLKFKLVGAGVNAGVQVRSRRVPNHHEMIGYQADLGDGYWGALYDESRRNKVLAAPKKEEIAKVLKRDDWNDYTIRCEGKRIRLWINDLATVDYTEADEKIEQRGLIGLQIHGGGPSEAWYKDVRIKELKAEGSDEAQYLSNIRQVTHDYIRAGEGYFSPDGKTILFQAEEKEGGNPFYQIFFMDLTTKAARRVSPGVGKTTCAYYHPDGKKIIFASSHLDPKAKEHYAAEYRQREEDRQAGRRRTYKWDFDAHMDIFEADPDGSRLKRLTDAAGYDAEGSYSPDGKQIVFCSNRSGPENLELYIMDADGGNVRKLTNAPNCYNGGPFFSPDGRRVIFRSDRKKKDHLQLYVIDIDGGNERALTDDLTWVQWGPFWHPDGRHIVYSAADHNVPGRPNYDVYWMEVTTQKRTRITTAPGADVLPVFSPDGRRLMWTSTRDGRQPAQLYIADFTAPK